ncbi:MAG: hypothetical protein AB8B79_14645 [Granulosicoccus sp.]
MNICRSSMWERLGVQAKGKTPVLNVSHIQLLFEWFTADMRWNIRVKHVRHPDGYVFRIGTTLVNS